MTVSNCYKGENMTKAAVKERDEAIERLREWIKPGDTVYTILDHVSSSGMSRAIRVVLPTIHGSNGSTSVDFVHPNWAVGKALGLRHWKRNGREQDALTIGGCGMDMGYHLVYSLSHTIYPEYTCLGKSKCPSNYHVNHRNVIQCRGFEDRICWRPDPYSRRFPVPEGWPMGDPIDLGEGESLQGPLLNCLHNDDDSAPFEVCPTCKGVGNLPNPEGPERFDLVHTDGYALRHRWL